ncbi:MAG: hypothetical protein WD044_13755 [Dongiaceae bacterium]
MITEADLDAWVRGHPREAQGIIVELIDRLLGASCPLPKEKRFPLGDSIEQHGCDGELIPSNPFPPFVPEGRSFWEIGTGEDAGRKATKDYRDLTQEVPADIRKESSFIFVTPHSGRKGWKHTWGDKQQKAWLAERHKKGEWANVTIIDGTRLIYWIRHFPSVESWLLSKMDKSAAGLESPDLHWELIHGIGAPPFSYPKFS